MSLISPSNRDFSKGQRQGDKSRSLSPATLSKLVECSPDALLAIDECGEIIWANTQTERTFGYTRDEILGQSAERLVPDRFREILLAYQRAFAVEPGILRTGDGLELTGRRRDGTDFPIEISLSLVEDDGERAIVLAVIRDISKRLRPEKALPESQEWFRAVLDNSPNLISLKDLEGRYLFVNREFQRVFHIGHADIEGKTDEEVFPADQAAAFRKNDLLVIQGGASIEFEEVALHDDGPHASIVQKFPLRDHHGALFGTAGIVTDITARKRTEEELLALKDELAAEVIAMTRLHDLSTRLLARTELQEVLQEVLNATIALQNADFGNVQLYNPDTLELKIVAHHGFQQGFLEYFGHVHEDSAACGRALQRRERVIIEDVETDPGFEPHRQIAASAGYRAVQSTPLFSRSGEPLGMISTHFHHPHRPSERELRLTDLYARQAAEMIERKQTEELLRQSEERFRIMVEGVKDYAIVMLDPEGRIVTWNAGADHITGYRADEVIGKHFSLFYTREEIESRTPEHNLEMATRDGRFVDEGWRLRKGGSRFWASVIIAAIHNGDGKLRGFSEVTRDLTERMHFEQELENERDRLRLLLELTNQVVSSLDLRGVFLAVSTSLRRFAQADAAMLLLPDPERNRLRLFALDLPESRGFLREGMHISVEGSHLGQVFRTGEPRMIEGPGLPPDAAEILRAAANEGVRSSCALPLIHKERIIGVLVLSRKAALSFIGGEVEFLLQAAAQVAIAVENALDYHQVIQARERLAEERLYLRDEIRTEYSFEEIVAESAALKRVLKQVERVAPTDSTVLILGETGSGKERVARAIHDCSARRDKSFIKVNCAAIPLGLLESELFGHEKGAFTGAITRRVGRFELAHQGTLFLDEVGDIPLELQPKLLRVLQDQEFERLGSTRTQRVDVRLVAATNRDLAQMIADRQFRDDLYYRLNVFPIRVPPLRDRPEDIPCLVRHFVSLYARRMNKRIDSISPGDIEAFARYPWPGNVRELQNFVERAVILSPNRVLRIPLSELTQTVVRTPAPDTTLGGVEREHILRALRARNWVIGGPKGAAAYLGLKRTTLLSKMERLGILRRSR